MATLPSLTLRIRLSLLMCLAAVLLSKSIAGASQSSDPRLTSPGSMHSLCLSPDGQELVYAGNQDGTWHLYLQTIGNPSRMKLTDGSGADTEPAFSPDGKQIAFRSTRDGGGLFLADRRGSIRKLTGNGFSPSWSPDGSLIVFSTADVEDPLIGAATKVGEQLGELRIVAVATGQQRLLRREDDLTEPLEPSWSPDGKRIAYWVGTGGANTIRTVAVDGTAPTDITDGSALDTLPFWSPDGRYLYFASDRGTNADAGLWRIPIDQVSGKPLGRPVPLPGINNYQDSGRFSLAKNSGRLVYTTGNVTQNVQRLTVDPITGSITGNATSVTTGTRQWSDAQPSPDGGTLALSEEGYRGALYIARADGSQLHMITKDPAWYRWPRWSPDGRELAVTVTRIGRPTPIEVRLITPDGSRSQRLTIPPNPVFYPFWEPGGAHVAVTDPALGVTKLVDVRSQKAPSTTLYSAEQSGATFIARSWAPNGEWLAGDLYALRPKGVALYSVSRHELIKLTDTGCCAVWLGDSQRIIFAEDRRLTLIDLRDRRKHELLSIGPDDIVSFALSHDDRSVFLIRRHVESDVRVLDPAR